MVRVRLFASLREAAGTSEIQVETSGEVTAKQVFDALVSDRPALGPLRPITLVAVNDDFAGWDTIVSPESEVAFFPPVSGGTTWCA